MFDRIKNLFRKAGAELGMVNSLTKIVDHPKINVEQSEYDRIAKSLQYFEGKFDDVKYYNSDHELKRRPYMSINMMKVVAKRMRRCFITNSVGLLLAMTKSSKMLMSLFSKHLATTTSTRTLNATLSLT